MKAYLIGFISTFIIIILNLVAGNAAAGFAPLHCWALGAIALIACGYGVWDAWIKSLIMKKIEEAGLLDEMLENSSKVTDEIIKRMDEDNDAFGE